MNRIVKDGKEEKCIIMKKSHNNTVYNDLLLACGWSQKCDFRIFCACICLSRVYLLLSWENSD